MGRNRMTGFADIVFPLLETHGRFDGELLRQ